MVILLQRRKRMTEGCVKQSYLFHVAWEAKTGKYVREEVAKYQTQTPRPYLSQIHLEVCSTNHKGRYQAIQVGTPY